MRAVIVIAAVVAVGVLGNVATARDDPNVPDEPSAGALRFVLAVDAAQVCHKERRGEYTDSLEDLLEVWGGRPLLLAAENELDFHLSVSRSGRSYSLIVKGGGGGPTYLERRHPDFVNIGPELPVTSIADDCGPRR